MSMTANLSNAAANAEASALAPLMNSGTIAIYSGPQPVDANAAIGSGNTLLATLGFSATAFGAASNGVITANAITPATAIASGSASFARILQSDGETVVMDCAVNTSNAGIVLNTTSIVQGASVSISSLVYSITET